MTETDAQRAAWEDWGEVDPFWAVLTDGERRGGWDVERFFETGETSIRELLAHAARFGRPVEHGLALAHDVVEALDQRAHAFGAAHELERALCHRHSIFGRRRLRPDLPEWVATKLAVGECVDEELGGAVQRSATRAQVRDV